MLIDLFNLELARHAGRWAAAGGIHVSGDFFMLRRFALHDRQFLLPSQPYLLREGRVVLVLRGEASYSFNLVEHRFRAGDLVVFSADTLVEKQGHSPDFEFSAFNFPAPPQSGDDAPAYILLHLDETTRPVVDAHFALLWQLLKSEAEFPAGSVEGLTASLLDFVRRHQDAAHRPQPSGSRREEQLRRFVDLVSRHAHRERNVAFYADRLCLAPHYLCTLVKQASGRTVMQWINQTCVKAVKVWLAYSDDTAAEIAHRLGFPHPASLTKFFKRETGLTPTEYRRKAFL
ncbi:MAG: helix-turn-helix transcriptional regulator [Bacteroidaceae bacterium]|nr:helix-turn-helix transcriptional regulator [Bacteroidaceae bacterium]